MSACVLNCRDRSDAATPHIALLHSVPHMPQSVQLPLLLLYNLTTATV